MTSNLTPNLDRDARLFFRDELRDARAHVLARAEDYQDLLLAIERLGAFARVQRCGRPGVGLGDYEHELRQIAHHASAVSPRQGVDDFATLFRLVTRARNEAAHQGVVARNLARNAVELALDLEAGLMPNRAEEDVVDNFMVNQLVRAEEWQPLVHIRRVMLERSFSFLPLHVDGGWHLVSDEDVASYLRAGPKLDHLEHQSISEARKTDRPLRLRPTEPVHLGYRVPELFSRTPPEHGTRFPCLVVDAAHDERLLGILTVFDLL